MRIAYVHDMPLPTTGADSEQVVNTVAALSRMGAQVTLVVPRRAGAIQASASSLREEFGVEGPFELESVPLPLPPKAPRALAKSAHAWAGPRHEIVRRADVVYTRNLPILAGALARGHRVAYEHFRPWGDQFPPLQPLLRTLMHQPRFVGAIFHSDHARGSFLRLGVPEALSIVAHNGFHPHAFEADLSAGAARARLGLPQVERIVTYAGRIHAHKGLDIVLEMARRMPAVCFLLVGSTEDGPIEAQARTLANVKVIPRQTAANLVPYLLASDVLLIPPSAAPLQRNTVLPLKVFGYLAAGRAIFGPVAPDTAEILRSGANAELVAPGDLEQAVECLEQLLADDVRRARLGCAAKAASADFTWDGRAQRILAFLRRRLQQGPVALPATDWSWSRWAAESSRWLLRRGRARKIR